MMSAVMRFATASGTAPSRPRPTSSRILRSSLATSSSAPSSTALRPSFHCSTTRIEYCSIASGCVVGTIRTAIWLPLAASNAASFCSRASRCCGLSVLVRSVTRAVSGGIATSAPALASSSGARMRTSRKNHLLPAVDRVQEIRLTALLFRRRRFAEIDLRRLADLFLVLDRELRLLLEAEQHCRQVAGELAHDEVVLAHRLDETVARHRDPVFGAFESRLQIAEVLVGLQLRIVLGHQQQSLERR